MATPAFRKYAAAAERIERLLSSTEPKNRTSLAMRPLHRMWRRTIDQIELARLSLPVRRLPAPLDGLVACQISDFHVDRDEDVTRLERAVDLINRQEPDLVFLTGDYFSGTQTMRRFVEPFGRILRDLRPRLGALAIAGNHDHWAGIELIAQALSGAGIELLSNASRRFALRGERLQIVGIDDLWTRRAEPSRAFSSVEPGDCTIVLAHNPDTAPHIVEYKPGVMLSGHTHGGVVRIPLYGTPLKSILRIGKQYYSGLNRYGDFYIYTNRGLGTFWVRVRMNCRPEVSRFSLMPLRPGDNRRSTRKRRSVRRR
jgi:predicted MPP superfamily phosphohydrolase